MISYSERRLRQVRMAAAVFGRVGTVSYPATREGFKAYWQHARIRARLFGTQWRRAIPEAYFKGNHFRPQRRLDGKAAMGYVYPDRVWVSPVTGFAEWSFRYHLLTDVWLRENRWRDEFGVLNLAFHRKACKVLLNYEV